MLENEKTTADQSKPFQTQTKDNELFSELTKIVKEFEINSFDDIADLIRYLANIYNYKQNGLLDFEKMTPNMQGITVRLCADCLKLLLIKQELKKIKDDLRNFLQLFVKKIKKSEDSTGLQRNKEAFGFLFSIYRKMVFLQKGQHT